LSCHSMFEFTILHLSASVLFVFQGECCHVLSNLGDWVKFVRLWQQDTLLYVTDNGLLCLWWVIRGGSRGVDWVASHPPCQGHLSLKLREELKLSLRWLCCLLFHYHSVRSAPPSNILTLPLVMAYPPSPPHQGWGKRDRFWPRLQHTQ